MNGAQRAAFKRMLKVAEEMNRELFLPPLNAALRDDLNHRWMDARNRYFELENEAREAKKSAQGRTRKRGNSRESASSAR